MQTLNDVVLCVVHSATCIPTVPLDLIGVREHWIATHNGGFPTGYFIRPEQYDLIIVLFHPELVLCGIVCLKKYDYKPFIN